MFQNPFNVIVNLHNQKDFETFYFNNTVCHLSTNTQKEIETFCINTTTNHKLKTEN